VGNVIVQNQPELNNYKKYILAGHLFNYPADIPIEIGSDIAVIPLKPGQEIINIFDKITYIRRYCSG
jgi:hypothetical protein